MSTRQQPLATGAELEAVRALPDELAPVRDQLGYALRNLSVAVWNGMGDAWTAEEREAVASGALEWALALPLSPEARGRVVEDQRTLERVVSERKAQEREEVALIGGFFLAMTEKTRHVRGYETNWTAVADMTDKVLGDDAVAVLVSARSHSPVEVRGAVRAALPFIAGLRKFSHRDYNAVVGRLRPLTSVDPEVKRMVSGPGLDRAVQSDADVRRTTSSKQVWQHGWFWWAAILGSIALLSNC